MTGKSRRTFYRLMDSGKLSYSIGENDRRHFETSELLRVFGDLNIHSVPSVPSDSVPYDTPSDLLRMLVNEVRALRQDNQAQAEQLAAIRKQLEERPLLEHKPPAPERAKNAAISNKPGNHAFSDLMKKIREGQEEEG